MRRKFNKRFLLLCLFTRIMVFVPLALSAGCTKNMQQPDSTTDTLNLNKKQPVVSLAGSPSPDTLIFQSGFGNTCKVITIGGGDNDITGKDLALSTKNDWVTDLENTTDGGMFNLQFSGGDTTRRYVKIVNDPKNGSNKVLNFWLHDYWTTDGQEKGRIQGNIYGIRKGIRELYQSIRVYIHKDFSQLQTYPHKIDWLTISEFWNNQWWSRNDSTGFRITMGIGKPTPATSQLNFILNAGDKNMHEIWNADNTNIKVPIDQWFTMEYYLKEGDNTTGRFYMAITPDNTGVKQVVFDVTNYTRSPYDLHPDGVTEYNPMKLYTSKDIISYMKANSKTLQIYWDDIKIWKNKRP